MTTQAMNEQQRRAWRIRILQARIEEAQNQINALKKRGDPKGEVKDLEAQITQDNKEMIGLVKALWLPKPEQPPGPVDLPGV